MRTSLPSLFLLLFLSSCSSSSSSPDTSFPDLPYIQEDLSTLDLSEDSPSGDLESDALLPPPPADPKQAGACTFTTAKYDLVVDEAGTKVALDIAVPDGEGPFPVIVFTHGFALNATYYQTYKQHLASWGFVAILPSMPGTAVSPKTHDELASYVGKILDWVQGDGNLPEGVLAGRADAGRIGLSGHSMGGKISLLVASQDARVDASFTVDPVDSTAPVGDQTGFGSVTPERMKEITIPLAFAGETVDAYPPEGSKISCAPAEDNFEQFFLHAVSPAYKFEFPGANHMAFLDNANCGIFCAVCQPSTVDPVVVREHTIGYLTAFYLMTLYGEAEQAYWLRGKGMEEDEEKGVVEGEWKNLE